MNIADLRIVTRPAMDALHRLPAWTRLKVAQRYLNQVTDLQIEVTRARRSAIRELRAEGHTLRVIGDSIGLGASRIKQIDEGNPDKPRHNHATSDVA